MTEEEARDGLRDRFGAPAVDRLSRFVALLLAENERQNLISPASGAQIWSRHVADCAQLVPLAPAQGRWIDIGSGAGLPGLVVAILRDAPTVLIEPRRLRVEFLRAATEALSLSHVTVEHARAEQVDGCADVISARAVAALDTLFSIGVRFAHAETLWLLPKGRAAEKELEAARASWHGVFHVEHSLTDVDARIVVAHAVRKR